MMLIYDSVTFCVNVSMGICLEGEVFLEWDLELWHVRL